MQVSFIFLNPSLHRHWFGPMQRPFSQSPHVTGKIKRTVNRRLKFGLKVVVEGLADLGTTGLKQDRIQGEMGGSKPPQIFDRYPEARPGGKGGLHTDHERGYLPVPIPPPVNFVARYAAAR